MPLLKNWIYAFHQSEDAAALLKTLGVRHTRSYLQKELLEHPNYPSLMSIADVLGTSYNVGCLPLQLGRADILKESELTPPFLAHIKQPKGSPVFATVTQFSNELIALYNPRSKKNETYTPLQFDEIYLGTILIARALDNAGEVAYDQHVKREKVQNILNSILAFALPILTIIACLTAYIVTPSIEAIIPIIFTMFTLCGSIVGTLLLWYEIDQYNPALKQICQAGKKVNCSAILQSKASRIFGLSWGSIGFCYFTGILMALLFSGIINTPVLQLLSWINILSLPYIVFSIYYQWKIAKQWCLLCLVVQGLLLLQFITAAIGSFHTLLPLQQIPFSVYISVLGAFVFTFIATMLLIPALEKAKNNQQLTIRLQQLKHNPQIFEALLTRQKSVEPPVPELGITIGNTEGPFKLVKVCNPYCGPCAKAHPVIEELIKNNEALSVQIIFTATEQDDDIKKPPVAHLLAINEQNEFTITHNALDDWYNAPVKDYELFAAKYPLNGELQQQNEKLKAMKEWCNKAAIQFTPAFFICLDKDNTTSKYYQLPESYTISDLKYFLSI